MPENVQGPPVIADKLSYFINTGEMTELFQQWGVGINYVRIVKFSPLVGQAAAPAVAAAPTGSTAPTVAAAQAGSGPSPSLPAGQLLDCLLAFPCQHSALVCCAP
jgi:hypothetical protein